MNTKIKFSKIFLKLKKVQKNKKRNNKVQKYETEFSKEYGELLSDCEEYENLEELGEELGQNILYL